MPKILLFSNVDTHEASPLNRESLHLHPNSQMLELVTLHIQWLQQLELMVKILT